MSDTRFATYNQVVPPPALQDTSDSYEDYYNLPTQEYKLPEVVADYEEEPDEIIEGQTEKQKAEQKAKKIIKKYNFPSRFNSGKQFAKTMNALYKQELIKRGFNPNLSVMLVAQDAYETAWGKSPKGKFNFGNITTNGSDWTTRTGNRKWKDFKSLQDYVSYKIDFLNNNRYQFFNYASINNISGSMQTLANRGYDSTNKQYGNKTSEVAKTVLKYVG